MYSEYAIHHTCFAHMQSKYDLHKIIIAFTRRPRHIMSPALMTVMLLQGNIGLTPCLSLLTIAITCDNPRRPACTIRRAFAINSLSLIDTESGRTCRYLNGALMKFTPAAVPAVKPFDLP
jgi:hypothetical protein